MISRAFLPFILSCSLAAAQECTRIVSINVVDGRTGHQIEPLESQELRAWSGKVGLPFSGLEKFTAGRVLILIDLSGSLQQEAEFVKHLGPALAQTAPAAARVAFGFFHNKIVISPGFTADPKDLSALIEQASKTPVEGKTLLLDAIHQGLQIFHDPAPGDTIVVITDGGDNYSRITRSSAMGELRASGVRLFSLIIDPRSENPDEIDGQNWLNDAARDSGGATFDIRTSPPEVGYADQWKKKLNDDMLVFWRETVLHGYSISLKVPAEIRKPTKWKLEIADKDDKRMKHAAIYYPHYLAPCGSLRPDATKTSATTSDEAATRTLPLTNTDRSTDKH